MKLLFLLPLIMASLPVLAQQPLPHPFPRTITVNGSAEMEIIPDEIFVNIMLREYQKRGEDKNDLETIKSQFLESCKAVGLPDSLISIISFTGYNNYFNYRKKKKNPDLMAGITYQVKFSSSKMMDALVEKLDDEATQSFVIAATSHSRIKEFRKDLKIRAVQAAKEKGQYLTQAIQEKLGSAITITEPDELQVRPLNQPQNVTIRGARSNSLMGFSSDMAATDNEIDFKKITLRYEVSVIFALQ
ncbi:MAG TPA: SIMPL domain-containing protein [Chitinophagaceae bacterium]|nr:SIMPL domain-containing protein [Chitinophagaceae bacterium]